MSARGVDAVLDVVECRRTRLEPLLVLGIPLGDARVEIPAEIVEPARLGQPPHLVEGVRFEIGQTDDDVCDLDAGVVDVVLDFNRRAPEAQDADERVAEGGIPQVADMCGLVRIDGRVLDDRLLRWRRGGWSRRRGQARGQKRRAIEEAVQVTAGGRLDAHDPWNGQQGGRQLLCDDAWRLPEPPCELEGDREREVAQRAIRRVVDRDGGQHLG